MPNRIESVVENSGFVNPDFRSILEEYSDMVLRLCFVTLKNRYDAEDAYQDVFLRLHLKLKEGKRFESVEHIKAWLIRVALNRCCTIRADSAKRAALLFDDRLEVPRSMQLYEDESSFEWVRDYLWELPEKYRKVLYLFYFEEFSTEEIARILGMTGGCVRTILNRARKKLKKIIEKKRKQFTSEENVDN